jgi:cytidylate kinase
MSIVICFSGGIGSGKTTLARAVAARLGARVASFGDYVRAEATSRGIGHDRAALQDLGETLIDEMGWPAFCRAVLEGAGWSPGRSLVVDGVRHVAALDGIRTCVAPTPTKLVFVDASRDDRQARVDVLRGKPDNLERAEGHSTEQDVKDKLQLVADLTLPGTATPEELVEKVVLLDV